MEKEAEEYINELEDKVIDLSLRLKSKTNELNLVYKTNSMKNLFKSKTAYDILDLFVQNKDRSFYLSEIVKEINRDPANVTREIDKLLNKDLLKMESKGK